MTPNGIIGLMLAGIILTLTQLLGNERAIMATLKELNDLIDGVAVGVDGLEAAIKDLKAQVAAGSPVSQADLDALVAKVQAIGTDIADTSDQG